MVETVIPRGAFELHLRDLPPVSEANALTVDLRVEERLHSGMATVMSRGDDRALVARIRDAFGIALPSGPQRVSNGDQAFIGIGPGVWLAMFGKAGPLMASELASSLAGLASVADQTSAYAVLRLTGNVANEVLSRGAFIDFDPSVFGPGYAAVTTISHIGVLIWQIDDAPTFEVALFSSYADSFWHWMTTACGALGVRLVRDGRSARI